MKTNEEEMFVAKIYNWNLRFFVFYVKKFLLLSWTRVTFFQDIYSDKKISNWTKATFRSWFLRLFRVFTKKKKRTCFGNNAGYFQNDRPCTKAVEQQEDRFATRQESLSYVARKADETPRPGISSTLLEHWTHRVIIRSRWTFTFHARFLFPFNNQWEQLYSRHIVVARHFEPNVWIRDEELK